MRAPATCVWCAWADLGSIVGVVPSLSQRPAMGSSRLAGVARISVLCITLLVAQPGRGTADIGSHGGGHAKHAGHGHHTNQSVAVSPSPPPVTPMVISARMENNSTADKLAYDQYDQYDADGDIDEAPQDGHELEGQLWQELNIDENRSEPVLKTVVLSLAALMLYGGWRTHCRRSSPLTDRSGPSSKWGGRHSVLPTAGDEELGWGQPDSPGGKVKPRDFGWTIASRNTVDSDLPVDLSLQRGVPPKQGGWTLDIFSLAAERLQL